MVITERVRSQFFVSDDSAQTTFIRIEQPRGPVKLKRNGLPWSADEHDRFLTALEQWPSGPWKVISALVGTRTARQTMTHAQKYREKIARVRRGTSRHVATFAPQPQQQLVALVQPKMPLEQQTLDAYTDTPVRSVAVGAVDVELSSSEIDDMLYTTLLSLDDEYDKPTDEPDDRWQFVLGHNTSGVAARMTPYSLSL